MKGEGRDRMRRHVAQKSSEMRDHAIFVTPAAMARVTGY